MKILDTFKTWVKIDSTNTIILFILFQQTQKRQLANINIHVQTYSGITLIDTINEKKTVTKYFNRIQLNKNVEKKNENMWETNLRDTHLD